MVVGSKMDLLDASKTNQKIIDLQEVVSACGLPPPILLSSLTLDNISQLKNIISSAAKKILESGFKLLPISYAACIRWIWSSDKVVWKESQHSNMLSYFHKIGDIIYCPSSGVRFNLSN